MEKHRLPLRKQVKIFQKVIIFFGERFFQPKLIRIEFPNSSFSIKIKKEKKKPAALKFLQAFKIRQIVKNFFLPAKLLILL